MSVRRLLVQAGLLAALVAGAAGMRAWAQEGPTAEMKTPPSVTVSACASLIKGLVEYVKQSPAHRGVWFVLVHNQAEPMQAVGYTRAMLRYYGDEELKGTGRHYMRKNTNPYSYLGGTHGEGSFSPLDFLQPLTIDAQGTPEPAWTVRLSTLFNELKIEGDGNMPHITNVKHLRCMDDVIYGYDEDAKNTSSFYLVSFQRVDNLVYVLPSAGGYSRFLLPDPPDVKAK